MGNLKLRKLIQEETTWKDKNKDEHKCHFVIHCILEVKTKQNIMMLKNVINVCRLKVYPNGTM